MALPVSFALQERVKSIGCWLKIKGEGMCFQTSSIKTSMSNGKIIQERERERENVEDIQEATRILSLGEFPERKERAFVW